ncbi:kinase-like protein [Auricularia subglabra TFB-10046 SS5]|nr:kinase-like protein [Auricularia subglabra TFB-10046 SS5]
MDPWQQLSHPPIDLGTPDTLINALLDTRRHNDTTGAVRILPIGDTVIFRESAFFSRHEHLPCPSEIRAAQTRARRSQTLAFPSLGLMMKHGAAASVAEAQCMWAVRHLLGDKVPVPEVYGWCTDDATGELFIYMELVPGVTLAEAWPLFSEPQRLHVCGQLRDMLSNLRRLQQDTHANGRFVGNISGGPLADCIFAHEALKPAGPFSSVAAFHDHYALKPWQTRHGDAYEDPYRAMLHDEAGIAFSHNDLSLSNILVADTSSHTPRISAIIDWHQAGWVPDYWECYKTRWLQDEQWAQKYLPLVLDDPNEEDSYWYWFAYTHMMGLA